MSAKANHKLWRWSVGAAVVGAGVGLAGIAVAGGGRAASEQPVSQDAPTAGSPGLYAKSAEESGPGLSTEDAVANVLTGMDGTAVQSARLIDAPKSATKRLPWVSVTVDSDQGGDDVHAVWLAQLVQGAVADQARTAEGATADVVGGGQLVDMDKAGDRVVVDLGTGSVAGGQKFGSPNDSVFTERAQTVANKFGLEVKDVQVLHPLESALSVTFTLPGDDVLTWNIDDLRTALAGNPTEAEGVFIEIDSPDGDPLLRNGAAYRTGGGGLWFAPGQDERFGAVHGGIPVDTGGAE